MPSPILPSIPRNGSVFMGSLLLATVLWFLFYLSRDFSLKVWVPIRLMDTVSSLKLNRGGIYPVLIRIQGRAWLINQYENLKKKDPLVIKGNFKFRNSLKIRNYYLEINNQLPSGIQCEDILTDSLILKKMVEFSKKIPLQMGYQVSFQKQYYFSNPARIYPDSITIIGSEFLIKGIQSWKLPNIQFNALNHSVDTLIPLTNSRIPDLRILPESARINIHVERFTENLISLPLKILNNEEGKTVSLLPSRVEITYLVPLSYYFTVRENLFETNVDLAEWKKNPGVGKLKVNLVRYPDFIRIVKKDPTIVDFIIYK